MNWLPIVAVLLAGGLLPLQALINARLGQATTGGLFASAASFVIGTAVMLVLVAAMRPALPTLEQATKLPAWLWFGGALGAAYVLVATLAIPRLGAAAMISLVVFGQMTGSILLDHFGVLHAAQPVNLTRLAGAALVALGAVLVVQPWKTA
jgi:bacterial/archaeal transporter family-2 protein